jgi:hypothetical protein
MESSEDRLDAAVRAPELARLFEDAGPFVSAYVTTVADVENAAQRSMAHWKTVRGELERAGAPGEVLDAVEALVPDAHHAGACLGIVASAAVVHAEHHAAPPRSDAGRWAPLPSVVPLLRWRQETPPVVVVLADRRGADLVALRRDRADVARDAGGEEFPLTKVHAGGWSARRYDARVEKTWEDNAADVAHEVARLAEQVRPRLVVAAGDERALALLERHLAPRLADRILKVPGGRGEGAGGVDDGALAALVAEAVAADTGTVVGVFEEERGQHDRAVEGVAPTMEALSRAAVDALLLAEGIEGGGGGAWFGPAPTSLSTSPDDLRAMGVDAPTEAPLADVVVRAALGIGAGVRFVPAERAPREGVGAVLRWS